MAAEAYTVKILEHIQVSPPPASVPSTSLPLTFFDLPWLLCRPMRRLFFYHLPPSDHHRRHLIQTLKHSLSVALLHFFPFASTLISPPPPHKPHILYTDGNSVTLTVAESAGDFDRLVANYSRDVTELHPLVPSLPPARVKEDDHDTRVFPLMAVQVTVFPNAGVCIGVTFLHVAADGRAFNQFMKSWAFVCRTGDDLTSVDKSMLPIHDRGVIKDPRELEPIFLKEWWNWGSSWDEDKGKDPIHTTLANKVRATFVMGRAQIERLKNWASMQSMSNNDPERWQPSTFVVTCAYIWVCLIKSQKNYLSDNHKLCNFSFVADCRNRLEFPLPRTYFGNCLDICFVSVKKSEILGENGIFMAEKAIRSRVQELRNGALKGADKWLVNWKEISEMGNLVTVAGSPNLRVYETDFGWGKPRKSEVVQIDVSGGISLAECGDGNGGVEFGIALNRDVMENFSEIFEHGLKIS